MFNKFILASISILLTNLAYGEKIYQLKDSSTGTTILTSNPDRFKSMTIVKVTSYPKSEKSQIAVSADDKKYTDMMMSNTFKSEAIRNYVNWIDNGSLGARPLIREKVTKRVGFSPLVIVQVKSGQGVIARDFKSLDIFYDNYNDCMSEKNNNLATVRKNNNFKLNSDLVYPKDTKIEYVYKCSSEITNVHTPVITKKELEKALVFIQEYRKKNNIIPIKQDDLSETNTGRFTDRPTRPAFDGKASSANDIITFTD